MSLDAHTLDVPAVPTGLTDEEVRRRHALGQSNDYRPPTSRSVVDIVRANVFTRFNALLGALLAVILVVGPLQDSLFGLTLVANTVVGIVQELRAKRTLDRLSVVTSPKAAVVRNGAVTAVPASDVVLDDLLALGAGDEVVVDAVVVTAESLAVDESLLTGESHPVEKSPGDPVLSGSTVVGGSARCVVTSVGEDAYAARLAADARRFALAPSELRDGVNRILQVITWVLIPTAAVLAWSQFSRGGSFADAARGSVAGTVTMVPEGLVLLLSIAWAVGGIRLTRHRVLPRELASVEGLARVDVLCIDKTGTLTSGGLTVDEVIRLRDRNAGRADGDVDAALGALSRLDERPNVTSRTLAERFPATDDWSAAAHVPFTSQTKWAAARFERQGWWVLGAPDVLLPADDPLLRRVDSLAAGGARVLVVGPGSVDGDVARVRPAALVTMFDELRTDAAQTLAYLADEGVAVKVISGDHPATVAALVARVGVDPGEPVDARTLGDDPDALAEAASATVVGRATPEQKRALVHALQAAGHVVAMTGDGVNDVLALKDADVGMAMGSGVPAARAVSQLVLLDDSFTSVPSVIGEGRRVIANIERVANLFVTKTVYATCLALAIGVARLPFPFLPRHLTLISSLTIGIPAFFLALAPNERRARPHFVARVARFSVPAGIVTAGATYLAYAEAREDAPTSLGAARTLATIVLFCIGLWILAILVRLGDDDSGRWIIPAMAVLFVLTLAIPLARTFFALQIPRPLVLLAGVGAAALSGLALELGWLVAGWLRPVKRSLIGR